MVVDRDSIKSNQPDRIFLNHLCLIQDVGTLKLLRVECSRERTGLDSWQDLPGTLVKGFRQNNLARIK